MSADTIKTIVVNSYNGSYTSDSNILNDYAGCFYYLAGAGGINTGNNNEFTGQLGGPSYFGASSGYVMAGYVDFNFPYAIDYFTLTATGVGGGTYGDTSLELHPLNTTGINGSSDYTGIYSQTSNPIRIWSLWGDVSPDTYSTPAYRVNPPVYLNTGFLPGTSLITPLGKYNVDQRLNFYTGSYNPYTYYTAKCLTSQFGADYNITGTDGATGSTTPGFVCGGGGFYGNSNTNTPGGYFNGTYNTTNWGYGVVSLIPNSMIADSINHGFQTLDITVNPPSDTNNFLIYSLMGGGGGGGGPYIGGGNGIGCGGGGAGDWITGILNTTSPLVLTIGDKGKGGTGNSSDTDPGLDGTNGGDTTLGYGLSNVIVSTGGKGGGGLGNTSYYPPSGPFYGGQGDGGAGFFGGGGGVNGSGSNVPYSNVGMSYTFMNLNNNKDFGYNGCPGMAADPSDNNYAGNGAGSIDYTHFGFGPFTQDTGSDDNFYAAGGGGGGFWGGNGSDNGDSSQGNLGAAGYGSGGGGGAFYANGGDYHNGGDGAQGCAVIRYLKASPYLKIFKITQNMLFNSFFLTNITGFWFFLAGDGGITYTGTQLYPNPNFQYPYLGKSYHNTGHFLVKEDGVRSVKFTNSGGYFTISVSFCLINQIQQVFNLKSNYPQKYAMIMFYV
jgi:hypothetical protein